jgi:3-hydroxyacyl-[acyl-carrier-protein] dehydratase
MSTTLSADDLMAVLPHREPILMIDDLVVTGDLSAAVGHRTIRADEPCYSQTEQTGSAAYPRALVVESLGQTAAALWLHRLTVAGGDVESIGVLYFAKAEGVTFFADVSPGDYLEHEVRFDRGVGNTAFMSGRTLCGGESIAVVRSIIAAVR